MGSALRILVVLAVLSCGWTAPRAAQVVPTDSIALEKSQSSVGRTGNEVYFFCEYGTIEITMDGYQATIRSQIPPEEIKGIAGRYISIVCAVSVGTLTGFRRNLIGITVLTGRQLLKAQQLQALKKGRKEGGV